MKKYLLPEKGTFYKANLHCHTTVSDGRLSPEEVKAAYMAEGYSVVAFTDHEVIVPHPELAEEAFLPLTGYEIGITETESKPWREKKTCHLCLVALEPDNTLHVCKHRTDFPKADGPMGKYRSGMRFVHEEEPDFIREHTPACVNEVIRRGRENGFFVTYNHPTWSLEDYTDYTAFHGMHAMEICNYGCIAEGYPDYNEREYDDMLRAGERLFCIAADDNHNAIEDSFGGFTMIKAEKLEYRAVTGALAAGNFYASQGPRITELWFEEGKVHIGCSDAERIFFTTGTRRAKLVKKPEGGRLNSAEFEVLPEDKYFRITVIDEKGYPANTNAYFTDSLF